LAQILDWLRRHGITQLVAQQLVEHLKANLEAADAAGPTPCGAADQSTMRV
jgi:hypothetical protein